MYVCGNYQYANFLVNNCSHTHTLSRTAHWDLYTNTQTYIHTYIECFDRLGSSLEGQTRFASNLFLLNKVFCIYYTSISLFVSVCMYECIVCVCLYIPQFSLSVSMCVYDCSISVSAPPPAAAAAAAEAIPQQLVQDLIRV